MASQAVRLLGIVVLLLGGLGRLGRPSYDLFPAGHFAGQLKFRLTLRQQIGDFFRRLESLVRILREQLVDDRDQPRLQSLT